MSVKSQLLNIFRIDKLYQNHVLHQEVMISDHYLIHFGQNFTIIKVNKDLNQLIISRCTDASLILQFYLLQMHLIFHGIILTIRTCLQADCIDFIVFSGTNKKGFFFFLPHDDGFNKVKNHYTESVYYSICDYYGVSGDKIWMNDDWFYTVVYAVFSVGTKG